MENIPNICVCSVINSSINQLVTHLQRVKLLYNSS